MEAAHPPEILGLLGDPLRWQLVAELGRSDRRVGELVQLVDKPQNVVSYHLAELRDAGIVSARRSSADGRDVYYRADLFRCRDLLGDVGSSIHAGLSLAPSLSRIMSSRDGFGRGCCSCAPATVRAPRWPRPLSIIGRPARRGPQRGKPSQAAAPERGAGHGRARSRYLRSSYEVTHPVRPQPLRSSDHPLRQGARDLPGVPGGACRGALEHRRSCRWRAAPMRRRPRVPTGCRRDRDPRGSLAR